MKKNKRHKMQQRIGFNSLPVIERFDVLDSSEFESLEDIKELYSQHIGDIHMTAPAYAKFDEMIQPVDRPMRAFNEDGTPFNPRRQNNG